MDIKSNIEELRKTIEYHNDRYRVIQYVTVEMNIANKKFVRFC